MQQKDDHSLDNVSKTEDYDAKTTVALRYVPEISGCRKKKTKALREMSRGPKTAAKERQRPRKTSQGPKAAVEG